MATLAGTLPELQSAFSQLSSIGAAHGITIGVADFGGERSQADTTQILAYRQNDYNADVKAGRVSSDTTLQAYRPINAFGTSWHNYGAAFDVAIVSRPSGMSDYDAKKFLGQFAPSVGLRWGGLFKNADPPHFELAISLADAKARYAALGNGSVQSLATDYSVADDPFSFDALPVEDDWNSGTDLATTYGDDDLAGDLASASQINWVVVGGLALVGAALYFFRD